MENNSYILYIGGFLNEKIVKERKLPTRNPAGSNRMHRIANALKTTGKKVMIVSPAISMRNKLSRIWLPKSLQNSGKVPVLFTPAIGFPIFGSLSTFISVPLSIMFFIKKRKVSAIIIYNFSPLLVLLVIIYGLIFRIPVYHNVEDVSFPKLSDWNPESEVRPVQQLVFYLSMNIIAKISRGFIVPAKRFIQYLDPGKSYRVVTGCIDVKHEEKISDKIDANSKVRILFSGKIAFEHGIDVFIETMQKISENELLVSFIEVDICGGGEKSNWLREKIGLIDNLTINYHGFVEDALYVRLLKNADICVALQNPHGRYATNKTPSKVYEYLGNYKAVIATDVGDLGELPEDVIVLCKPFTSAALFENLRRLIENRKITKMYANNAGSYAYEHFSYEKVGAALNTFMEQ